MIEEEKESFLIKSIECTFCNSKARTLHKLNCNFSICAKCKGLNKNCFCLFCSQLSKAIQNQPEKNEANIQNPSNSSETTIQQQNNTSIVKSGSLTNFDKNRQQHKEIKLFAQRCEKCNKSYCVCESRKGPRVMSSCEEEMCKEQNKQTDKIDLKPKVCLIGTSNGIILNVDLLRSKIISEKKVCSKKINCLLRNNNSSFSFGNDGFIRKFSQEEINPIAEFSTNGDPIISSISLDENQILCGFENKNSVGLFETGEEKIKLNKEFTSNINYPIQSMCRFTNDLVLLGEKQSMNGKVIFLNLSRNMVQFGIETGTDTTVNNLLKLKYSLANHFLCSNTSGMIKIFDLKAKLVQNHNVDSSNCSESKIVQLTDERIVFSSNDFQIKFIDLKSKQLINENLNFHKDVVLDLCQIDPYLLASCSKDSSVALWDIRRNSLLSKIELPKEFYPNVMLSLSEII